jgi:hypothetical protein
MQKLSLPIPAPEALAASQALQQLIIDDIRQHQGWIPFSRYMELALYAGSRLLQRRCDKIRQRRRFYNSPGNVCFIGATLARWRANYCPPPRKSWNSVPVQANWRRIS